MKKVYLVSLGCPKNTVDSEVLLGLLEEEGYIATSHPREAQVLLVNTCAFIQDAVEESIDTILTLAKMKHAGQCLVVAGCLPQRYGEKVRRAMPEVDIWVDLHNLESLPALIKGRRAPPIPHAFLLHYHHPRRRLTSAPWAYLKIAEGCSNRCSYCTIPYIKGPFRSRPIGDIVQEVRRLAADGVLEINIVSQDITRYGEDIGYKYGLLDLLDTLEGVEGIQWIRLMYAHPAGVTPELASRIGKGKVLPYLEMPIQHVNDKVLSTMGRRGGKKAVMEALDRVSRVGGVFLRTTVMVGFPSEGEAEFQELMGFLRGAPIFRLAVFPYSPEEGTPAYTMKHHRRNIILERYNEVLAIQSEIHLTRNLELVGKSLPVLVEDRGWGRFPGQAPEVDGKVRIEGKTETPIGMALITEADGVDLYGSTLPSGSRGSGT